MIRPLRLILTVLPAAALIAACQLTARDGSGTLPHNQPFLSLPHDELQSFPPRLSQTGAFSDTGSLTPSAGLASYDLNVPFYSDGAAKRRWISLPGRIRTTSIGTWRFPAGTVFVKHFELPASDPANPPTRLETRILIRDAHDNVFGATYRWRPDNSDADLVTTASTETLPDNRRYYFPAPRDCRSCHTHSTGGVLGFTARQLDRTVNGRNQLDQFASLFENPINSAAVTPLAPLGDTRVALETRVRSYLDANCSQCHRPGEVNDFDLRFETPLEKTGLFRRAQLNNGIDHARVLARRDPWRTMLLARTETVDSTRMPPIGRETVDHAGIAALREWILSLPGPPVLAPPIITGPQTLPTVVTMHHDDPASVIRYTLDGSAPAADSQLYTGPLRIGHATIVRAAAFKSGAMPSITVQQLFSDDP